MDGNVISLAAMLIAGITLLLRVLDKSLSIREHEEFRSNIKEQFARVDAHFTRDVDRIEHRLDAIEQTRPSNETLSALLNTKKETTP